MATELKILNVKNEEEGDVIQFWMRFGWQLKSSQRVYNQDSHTESRGSKLYSVTETVDFTKIILERDKNLPNYEKITELETKYLRLIREQKPKPPRYDTVEEWVAYQGAKWDIRDKKRKQKDVRPILISAGIFVISIIFGVIPHLEMIGMILRTCAVLGLVGGLIFYAIASKKAVKQALSGEDAEGKKFLQKKFQEHISRYDAYMEEQAEIVRVLEEVEALL